MSEPHQVRLAPAGDAIAYTLSHAHTLTLSHSHTLTLTLSHSHTLTLSHSHTHTLSHSHSLTLSHSHTGDAIESDLPEGSEYKIRLPFNPSLQNEVSAIPLLHSQA